MLGLYEIIKTAFTVMEWLIIIRVIISWLNVSPGSKLVRFIYEFTEPILAPFRKLMPRGAIPLDFSPIIALIVLQLVENLILRLLF